MTGIFVRVERRVERGTKWCDVEVDQLTDEELDKVFLERPIDQTYEMHRWVIRLAKWIRDNVREGRRVDEPCGQGEGRS